MSLMQRLSNEEQEIVRDAQNDIPVRLSEVARRLGLTVRSSTLPAGISGEIRPARGSFEIKVNRHDSKGRQRFTVAHELAHYLLHRDQIGQGVTDDALYRSSLSDAREAEANRLAAEILMPLPAVRAALEAYGGPIEERSASLAQLFGVSEVAFDIRLGQLR